MRDGAIARDGGAASGEGLKTSGGAEQELETNVALRVEDTDDGDTVLVSGRGLLHLTVLIENMRRESFEMMVGPPQVCVRVRVCPCVGVPECTCACACGM